MIACFQILAAGQQPLKWVVALQNLLWTQRLLDKRCESGGSSIQPQDPWRVAWRKWILLPITPHSSQALFQSRCFPFSSLEEGRKAGSPPCSSETKEDFTHFFFFLYEIWLFSFLHAIHERNTPNAGLLTWLGEWKKWPHSFSVGQITLFKVVVVHGGVTEQLGNVLTRVCQQAKYWKNWF